MDLSEWTKATPPDFCETRSSRFVKLNEQKSENKDTHAKWGLWLLLSEVNGWKIIHQFFLHLNVGFSPYNW